MDGTSKGGLKAQLVGRTYDEQVQMLAPNDAAPTAPGGAAPAEAAGATPEAAAPGQPANLHHSYIIPIVEPALNDPTQKTWLGLNAETGGVAFVIGDELRGKSAAALPLGTQEPMYEMFMVDQADGSVAGFVGAEHAQEAHDLAAKEDKAGAVAVDCPDMRPAPANLEHVVLEPTVMTHPHNPAEGLIWVAVDKSSGKVSHVIGDEHEGKNAKSLPAGTKGNVQHLWMVPTADGQGTIGNTGLEGAGNAYDAARKEASAASTSDTPAPAAAPAPAAIAGGGIIQSGARLVAVQERLTTLGYPCGKADGIMGPRTRAAIVSFQRAKGLVADGIVGPKTQAALDAG